MTLPAAEWSMVTHSGVCDLTIAVDTSTNPARVSGSMTPVDPNSGKLIEPKTPLSGYGAVSLVRSTSCT
jgi:hypothetical protein